MIIKYTNVTLRIYVFSFQFSTLDGINVIAVGISGRIFYSSNQGSSWTLTASSGTTSSINCVAHGSSSVAMVGGGSSFVARTVNGGVTWTTLSVFSASNVVVRFHSIGMIGVNVAYIAGNNGQILVTYNGGSSWRMLASGLPTLYGVTMYDAITGIVGTVTGNGLYNLVPGKDFVDLNF